PSIRPVLINEILSASVAPDVDQIELFNPNAESVDIGGWFLTDDPAAPQKFRIPDGTVLAPGAFRTFSELDFNPTPGVGTSFSLSSRGEQVYLFSAGANGALTGFSHGFSFGASGEGISFGRYVNSVGEEQFPAQIASSFGAANAG